MTGTDRSHYTYATTPPIKAGLRSTYPVASHENQGVWKIISNVMLKMHLDPTPHHALPPGVLIRNAVSPGG